MAVQKRPTLLCRNPARSEKHGETCHLGVQALCVGLNLRFKVYATQTVLLRRQRLLLQRFS
jgi:hypothetical protein